jgi:FkbH-like protein
VPPGSSPQVVQETLHSAVNEWVSLWKALRQRSNCSIIQNNADLPYDRVFGNYDSTPPWSEANLLAQFNLSLSRALEPGVSILDLDFLASVYGRRKWHDRRFWYHSKHPFALDATGLVARQLAKTIGAVKGSAKKCLVLDLDNTLWGGVIADDGLDAIQLGSGAAGEAYVDFQRYLLRLKERGIILAVCSKNEEVLAQEPFLKHPDMVLKLEDIVIFKANWKDKASNIKEIAESLNIGLGSIVLVDDNPVEREFVKITLPEVSVPEMPSDPSDYIDALNSCSYFETVGFSDEDSIRSQYYRSNIERAGFQNQFTDLSDYLRSLEMEMIVGTFDEFHLPRIAQLINKSNQFHLTTTRYSESEIASIQQDKGKKGLYFKLKDRFGDNGLISAVILHQLPDSSMVIDTWVMSCRVLSRGVEEFICTEIISYAKEQKCSKLIGKYIPTLKNKLVEDLYGRLNFNMIKKDEGTCIWELDLNMGKPEFHTFIQKIRHKKIASGV